MPSLRQWKQAETVGATNLSITLDSTPNVGNLLVAVVTATANVSSPVHPWGNTPNVAVGGASSFGWITSKIAGSSESATVAFSNTFSRGLTITVYEFVATPGRTWVSGFDKNVSASGSSVTSLAVGPTATQTDYEDVAVGLISLLSAAGSVGAMDSGYTVPSTSTSAARGWAGYKLLSSNAPTSFTGSWTTARNAVGAIATYKQTGTASAPSNSGFFAIV